MLGNFIKTTDRLVSLTVLYHRKDTASAGFHVASHQHPFWQADWLIDGRAGFLVDGRHRDLAGGSAILIGPGEVHHIEYREPTRYLSVKFEWSGPRSRTGARALTDYGHAVWSALERYLPPGERADGPMRINAGRLLLAWLVEETAAVPDTSLAQSSAIRAREALAAAESPFRSVRELAAALGYSANHLAAVYQREICENLKSALDREVAARASSLLAYSESGVAEVAERCGFPDLYGFSRFYKRVTGQSPRDFRRAIREGRRIVPVP